MNNYVPIVLMSMLSNMDFQATLTKDAVIEYMTKYMTKAGQGSLVHVMEHSFAACLEKAKEAQQGSGSAILRCINLQSITEVKSQLETMHLLSDTTCRHQLGAPMGAPARNNSGATVKASAGGIWKAIAGGQNHHAHIHAHAHTCPCIYYSNLNDTNCKNTNI